MVGPNWESKSSGSRQAHWLSQLPSLLGRYLCPAFTQAHFLHFLSLLHLQQTIIHSIVILRCHQIKLVLFYVDFRSLADRRDRQ